MINLQTIKQPWTNLKQWICYPTLCLPYRRVTHSLDSVALSLFLPLFLFQSCSMLGLIWHVVFAANWHLHPCLWISMVTNKMGPWTCQHFQRMLIIMNMYWVVLHFTSSLKSNVKSLMHKKLLVLKKSSKFTNKKSKNAQINSVWVVNATSLLSVNVCFYICFILRVGMIIYMIYICEGLFNK